MAAPPTLLQSALDLRSQLDTLISQLQEEKDDYAIAQTKRGVLDQTFKMERALMGPMESLLYLAQAPTDQSALAMMIRHRWFDHFPASSDTLSEKTGVPAEVISRLLKMLATHDIVYETTEEKDGVQADIWNLGYNGIGLTVESIYELIALMYLSNPTAFDSLVEYYDKYPKGREKSNESVVWMLTGMSSWERMAKDKAIELRTLKAMESFTTADFTTPVLLSKWLKQNGKSGKVIDLGGGAGYISSQVCGLLPTDSEPKITFEIQDLFDGAFNQFVSTGRIPASHTERIKFRRHNFFEPQPKETFDEPITAVLTRFILHDWTDEDASKILTHIVPILEANPDAALLINDSLLPEAGDKSFYPHEERIVRRMDLTMMVYANAKERMLSQWKKLFGMVDSRLQVEEVLWYNDLRGALCMPVIVIKLKKNFGFNSSSVSVVGDGNDRE